MFNWNRLFFKKPKSGMNIENFEAQRKLTKNGNSWTISIPPIVIEDMGLHKGVNIKRKNNKLIITKIGDNS